MSNELRLQVFMSRSGVGSRRKCEEYIQQGLVQVNGRQVTVLGSKVSESDRVTVGGKAIRMVSQKYYLALHKPVGYICANDDPQARPLASDLFSDQIKSRLFHVGRLDFTTSGLIFYTNDGEFARKVMHPSTGIEKEYLVQTREEIPDTLLEQYLKGITIEGEHYRLKEYSRNNPRTVSLVLLEGKNREIRKVFSHYRLKVRKIHRVRIGIVNIRGIPLGAFRFLSRKEIDWFMKKQGAR